MAILLGPIKFGDLVTIAQMFPWQFPGIAIDSAAIQFRMASVVLRKILGDEWSNVNLVSADGADPHLSTNSSAPFERARMQARLVGLAEVIFNLQGINGAKLRFEQLRKGSVETAVADLEAARLLAISEVSFHFVRESGEKGLDYDIEIRLPDNKLLCCESKCKINSTTLSEKSILNSLRDASKQVPECLPGAVFVKLPEEWIRDPHIERFMQTAIQRFFGRTGRIVHVVFHWEEWHSLEGTGVMRLAKYREFVNGASRFFAPPLLREYSPPWISNSWRKFSDAIDAANGRSS